MNATTTPSNATPTGRQPLLTPRARLSFPHLFNPRPAMPGQPPKYSCVLLFDAAAQATPEFAALKAAARKAAVDKWGERLPPNLRSPFRDGSERPNLEGYAGCVFITVSSNAQNRPGVVMQTPTGRQRVIDEADIYPGCYVIASVNAYAYDAAGNRGVAFGLRNILKVADGPPLTNRTTPEHDFASVTIPVEELGGQTATDMFVPF